MENKLLELRANIVSAFSKLITLESEFFIAKYGNGMRIMFEKIMENEYERDENGRYKKDIGGKLICRTRYW